MKHHREVSSVSIKFLKLLCNSNCLIGKLSWTLTVEVHVKQKKWRSRRQACFMKLSLQWDSLWLSSWSETYFTIARIQWLQCSQVYEQMVASRYFTSWTVCEFTNSLWQVTVCESSWQFSWLMPTLLYTLQIQWTLTNPTPPGLKGVQSTEMFRFEKHVSIILFKLINLKFILKRIFIKLDLLFYFES